MAMLYLDDGLAVVIEKVVLSWLDEYFVDLTSSVVTPILLEVCPNPTVIFWKLVKVSIWVEYIVFTFIDNKYIFNFGLEAFLRTFIVLFLMLNEEGYLTAFISIAIVNNQSINKSFDS